ncbi:MAG: class I SAM-dependent RNA methyltransferase [bacterium]|nr:MAG: class I SAM-dependent RNA methyltransferase [bacterium]
MSGTATVNKIIYGGWGLAHHEGHTLFLPYTAPGDVVRFSVTKKRKNCLYGRVEEILEPSPIRVQPDCPVFGLCGGCHLLHISYDDEIEAKMSFVLESLERIGKIRTKLTSVIRSPDRFAYRNHAVYKVDAGGNTGFTMPESRTVVPFPEAGCLLLPAAMRDAIASQPKGHVPGGGEVRVRIDRHGTVHFWGLRDAVGPPEVLMEARELLFPIHPDAFFQVNRLLNDRLLELVVSLPAKVRRSLVDLYCGTGFFTLGLASIYMEGLGIERNRAAVRNAAAAARLNKISHVRFKRDRIESAIGRIRETDIIVADPPRAGLTDVVLRGITRLRPKELILVSCDPPTLSRDVAKLIDTGFILAGLHLVDLFPGTYHVETVTLLRRT